jgi:hypothetical protein
MPADCLPLYLGLIQVQAPRLNSSALHFVYVSTLAMGLTIVILVLVLRYLHSQRNVSQAAKLREEFEKSKDVLLAAAQAKHAAAEAAAGGQRELTAEEKERELLQENVDPEKVFGQTCPLSGLEMMDDQELVIDPYSGQGYHFSSFINDWPRHAETHEELPRPKFIYRYPQGTVVKTADLLRGF